MDMAAFLALISRRGAAGFDALIGISFCLPFTSSTVPLYAGAGTPSNPGAVGVGTACARRMAVMDLKEVETNVDRDDDAMGAKIAIVGAECRREAVSIDMLLVNLWRWGVWHR